MSRGRLRTFAGWLCVLAGVGLVGWVAWQIWGTTWTAERRHDEIVSGLEREWARGGSSVHAAGQESGAVVRIPRFGSDYAVPLVEGTDPDALASGIGRDLDGATPGGRGNLVLVAHRITHGEPFRDLPELEPGDEVLVQTADATYRYVLDTGGEDLEVSFDAGWVLDPHPVNPDRSGIGPADSPRLITLATCAELFATDQRLVVFGHLAGVVR